MGVAGIVQMGTLIHSSFTASAISAGIVGAKRSRRRSRMAVTARTVSPACRAASGRLAPEARAVRILRSRAVGLRCCWLVVSMWA